MYDMTHIYSSMIKRNNKLIQQYGFSLDQQLKVLLDTRYCQAIFSPIINFHFTKTFEDLIKILPITKGVLYVPNNINYINQGTLHFTFMQIESFEKFSNRNINVIEQYFDIFKKLLHDKITIKYNQLVLTQKGLLLCGESDTNINEIRDSFRTECEKNKLSLFEPYINDIVHSTLFRFCEIPSEEEINKLRYYLDNKIDYGIVTLTTFHLAQATWKVNKNEINIQFSYELK